MYYLNLLKHIWKISLKCSINFMEEPEIKNCLSYYLLLLKNWFLKKMMIHNYLKGKLLGFAKKEQKIQRILSF